MLQKYLMDLLFSIEQLVQLEADYKFTVLYLYKHGEQISRIKYLYFSIWNQEILWCEIKKLIIFYAAGCNEGDWNVDNCDLGRIQFWNWYDINSFHLCRLRVSFHHPTWLFLGQDHFTCSHNNICQGNKGSFVLFKQINLRTKGTLMGGGTFS